MFPPTPYYTRETVQIKWSWYISYLIESSKKKKKGRFSYKFNDDNNAGEN